MANAPISRLLWEYSLPAIVGMLANSLNNIIDRVYIGQGVGTDAISGLGITFPVSNISAALGVLVGAGAAARTSLLLGAGNRQGAARVLGNSLVLTLIIATVYIAFFAVFVDDILYAFGASEATLPYAHDFMVWYLPGMFFTNLCFNLNNVMRASGYPSRAMATMLVGAGCNIVLAPIFIFAFGLGIKGAAIATDISMIVATIFVFRHFLRPDSTVRFIPGIYRLKGSVVGQIVYIGAAPSVINAASCLISITINHALKRYGSDLYIGAASIFITYTATLTSIVLGVGLGMQPIIGYNYGAGLISRLKKTYRIATIAGTVICTCGCLFGLLFPTIIARAFTSDPVLVDVTADGLRMALPMFWAVGFQITSTSLFQALGMAGKSITMGLMRQVIFIYPLLRLLPPMLGLDGVWYSFPLSDLFATIVTIVLVIWQFRQINHSRTAPRI